MLAEGKAGLGNGNAEYRRNLLQARARSKGELIVSSCLDNASPVLLPIGFNTVGQYRAYGVQLSNAVITPYTARELLNKGCILNGGTLKMFSLARMNHNNLSGDEGSESGGSGEHDDGTSMHIH